MRPSPGTYPAYYEHYLQLVKEDNIIDALKNGQSFAQTFISGIAETSAAYAYAEDKWSVKEVISHILDTERILAYRALRFARLDPQQPLSFDQNAYVKNAELDSRHLSDLLKEFETIRLSSRSLFETFSNKALVQKGMTGAGETTVLALGFMICGHANHHLNVLKERYHI
jgi:hypothetical protein